MTTTTFAISLIAAHFIGDWLLQSRFIAQNKSKNLYVLGGHLCIVGAALCVAFLLTGYQHTQIAGIKFLIYILAHGVQDWFIWRFYAKYFHNPQKPDIENSAFFKTIAIDQFIHLSLLMYLFL